MPYWRLSGFYFFYFATLGVLVPYWGLYLKSVGYSARDIGSLLAVIMMTRIVAPILWAWLADHRRQRLSVIRLSTFLAAVGFAGVFFDTHFWWLVVVMLVFSFFWHATLPLLEVTTMNHVGQRPGRYGKVRLWGSLGFIASVIALGIVVDHAGPWWVLPSLFLLISGIWFFSLSLPALKHELTIDSPGSPWSALLQPQVVAFLLTCLLMQLSHGPYYTFYSIYLEGYGYSKTVIGSLWALGVVSEIGVFLVMPKLLSRAPLRQVLLVSFGLAALRWLLIGMSPQNLAILILAQTLHGATFGSFHATAIQMVHQFFTGRHQHRGQAIYSSASFGIGGALGSFYSGYTWDTLGPLASFEVAAGAAIAAWLIAWVFLRPKS